MIWAGICLILCLVGGPLLGIGVWLAGEAIGVLCDW